MPSPEYAKISNFRTVTFSSYLEFRAMDKVQKPSGSECCTPSSEPFRFYFTDMYGLVFVKLITKIVAFIYTVGH
jgi:hypothetical protein